jgi:hypothetical protein
MRKGPIMAPVRDTEMPSPPHSCGAARYSEEKRRMSDANRRLRIAAARPAILQACLSESFECDRNRTAVYDWRSKLINCQFPVPDVQVFPEK